FIDDILIIPDIFHTLPCTDSFPTTSCQRSALKGFFKAKRQERRNPPKGGYYLIRLVSITDDHALGKRSPYWGRFEDGVLGIFRPKTTKCSGGRAVRGLQRGITFR
ncbi:hypothetical protein EGK61_23460, partial [Escherichia coli]